MISLWSREKGPTAFVTYIEQGKLYLMSRRRHRKLLLNHVSLLLYFIDPKLSSKRVAVPSQVREDILRGVFAVTSPSTRSVQCYKSALVVATPISGLCAVLQELC